MFLKNARALDREKMSQSVEKMRETVRAKVLRDMERVEKEKIELIQSFLSQLKDKLQNNLRNWVDEAIGRVILQKRVRDVDQTRREVEGLEQRCRAALAESSLRSPA